MQSWVGAPWLAMAAVPSNGRRPRLRPSGGRPPPGISAASFQFEEGEEPEEEEKEEADREKHDCSSILMVAAVLLYAIAKQAEDETLSHSSFFCHESSKRERIYSACALTNREGGEMTSGEGEQEKAKTRQGVPTKQRKL